MPPNILENTTEEEYLIREPQSEYKHEFRQGKMIAMSGASRAHVLIAGNIHAALHQQLKGKPCEAFMSDMRVKVAAAHFYTYPDVSVVCGTPRFDGKDPFSLTNPSLIVEVLSPSSEAYDRGEKFSYYEKLASLREYVLVSQEKMRVERFQRNGAQWDLHDFEQVGDRIDFPSIGCAVAMRDIYEKVGL